MKIKHCKKCGKDKPVDEFYENKKSRCHSVYCKPCQSKYNHENKDKSKSGEYNARWMKKRRESDPVYGQKRYSMYINRFARNPEKLKAQRFLNNLHGKDRRPIHPNLTLDFITQLFIKTKNCQCCGKQLRVSPPDVKGTKCHDAASIDRINNQLDYIPSNIGIVCLECNTRKRDLTITDLEMILAYIKRCGNV